MITWWSLQFAFRHFLFSNLPKYTLFPPPTPLPENLKSRTYEKEKKKIGGGREVGGGGGKGKHSVLWQKIDNKQMHENRVLSVICP